MKPVLFVLNDRCSIKSKSTNATLMLACLRQGHPVFVTDVVHLQATSASALFAEALRLPPIEKPGNRKLLEQEISQARTERVSLADLDAVFVRTTPGQDVARAWAHRLAIEVLGLASESGIRVFNCPLGLQKASSKLYTVCLPEQFVPRTMVCHSLKSVQDFADQLDGPLVIKPLLGSQGRDVFFIEGVDSLNTRQVVDILGRTGYLVVQEYLPEASHGDIRVLTLDDQIIQGSTPIGIRRTPGVGERRSNVSLGGTASVVELTEGQTAVCLQIAGRLCEDGIRFSGLDLIGEKIVEVNVFSPSGLQEFETHIDPEIPDRVVRKLLNFET